MRKKKPKNEKEVVMYVFTTQALERTLRSIIFKLNNILSQIIPQLSFTTTYLKPNLYEIVIDGPIIFRPFKLAFKKNKIWAQGCAPFISAALTANNIAFTMDVQKFSSSKEAAKAFLEG